MSSPGLEKQETKNKEKENIDSSINMQKTSKLVTSNKSNKKRSYLKQVKINEYKALQRRGSQRMKWNIRLQIE